MLQRFSMKILVFIAILAAMVEIARTADAVAIAISNGRGKARAIAVSRNGGKVRSMARAQPLNRMQRKLQINRMTNIEVNDPDAVRNATNSLPSAHHRGFNSKQPSRFGRNLEVNGSSVYGIAEVTYD